MSTSAVMGVTSDPVVSASAALETLVEIAPRRFGWDQETHPIGPQAVYPRPVCATFSRLEGDRARSCLIASGDAEWVRTFDDMLGAMEADPRLQAAAHNGHGFDIPVQMIHSPHRISRIFRILARGVPRKLDDVLVTQFRDTLLREKLLNLALHGVVDYYFTPDGKARDLSYKLAALVAKWLGQDRTASKGQDAEGNQIRQDVWRLAFGTLDGLPSSQYPPEAAAYALEDASDALLVSLAQDRKALEAFVLNGAVGHDGKTFDVFRTEGLHVAAMVCLSLATHEGFGVDAAEVAGFEAAVEKARSPQQTEILYKSELYSRPLPLRNYANNARHGNSGKPCACAAAVHDPGTPKMCAPEPHHLSKKRLVELIVKTWAANRLCDEDGCPKQGGECDKHGLGPLKRTDPSDTFPDGQISTDSEVIADLAPLDESGVLEAYDRFTITNKLVEYEIPRLKEALAHGGVIHGGFDDFKKTSRTSSRRSKLYPSINIQQIARGFELEELGLDGRKILDAKGNPKTFKIEPRHAYTARKPGWVLVSIDYSFIELVTLAQTTKRVIGYSVLLDKINKGFDPHAFLGAQLAVGLDQDFADACRALGKNDPDDVYRFFVSLKAGADEEKKFYKTWRQFAKPVGLGFPGGLGARTFIIYAKKLYNITIKSIEQAKSFKVVWGATFPENMEYLNRYVRDNLRDDQHSDDQRERFAYFSPLGAYRARCSFTEVANGLALQTPAAEGMKIALFNVQRACWDPEADNGRMSCLYGCRVNAAIHDELLISMPDDAHLHERAFEASRLWVQGMNVICSHALVKAEPAAMRKWDKGAEPVYSRSDSRLRVWEPHVKYKSDEEGRLWTA